MFLFNKIIKNTEINSCSELAVHNIKTINSCTSNNESYRVCHGVLLIDGKKHKVALVIKGHGFFDKLMSYLPSFKSLKTLFMRDIRSFQKDVVTIPEIMNDLNINDAPQPFNRDTESLKKPLSVSDVKNIDLAEKSMTRQQKEKMLVDKFFKYINDTPLPFNVNRKLLKEPLPVSDFDNTYFCKDDITREEKQEILKDQLFQYIKALEKNEHAEFDLLEYLKKDYSGTDSEFRQHQAVHQQIIKTKNNIMAEFQPLDESQKIKFEEQFHKCLFNYLMSVMYTHEMNFNVDTEWPVMKTMLKEFSSIRVEDVDAHLTDHEYFEMNVNEGLVRTIDTYLDDLRVRFKNLPEEYLLSIPQTYRDFACQELQEQSENEICASILGAFKRKVFEATKEKYGTACANMISADTYLDVYPDVPNHIKEILEATKLADK